MPMKKNITLLFCFLANLAVQAQTDFPLQFVDKEGQVIPDGTVLDITDVEIDELFGDIQMPVNVWVKNVSTQKVQGGGVYSIQSISNGWLQTCFPVNCMRRSNTGSYSTESSAFAPGQSTSLQTEWLPNEEGVCVVTYQLQTYAKKAGNSKWTADADGPTITLKYKYVSEANGISTLKSDVECKVYDLSGRIVDSKIKNQKSKLGKGLYIINGKKVIR